MKALFMHLSNGLAAEWVSWQWNIQYKHSIQPTVYTDTQYIHWHVFMRKCWPSALQVYSRTDSHCKPNTEEPEVSQNAQQLNEGLQTARQSQANPCFEATWWWTFKTDSLHSLTFGNKSPSPPSVGNEGSKHATKIKTIFSNQIHTDKFLSKNIFSSFFFSSGF